MDKIFFEQLDLPKPKYALSVGSGTQAEETGKALIGVEKVNAEEIYSRYKVQEYNTITDFSFREDYRLSGGVKGRYPQLGYTCLLAFVSFAGHLNPCSAQV